MVVATYLLAALAVLRAADGLCCHVLAHHLRHFVPARGELVVHLLRGPLWAALFAAVPNCRCEGRWFVALLAVFAADLLLALVDCWLESRSRRELGGLPRGEAMLHLLLAMTWGALVFAVLTESGSAWPGQRPTSLQWLETGAPAPLRIGLGVAALLTLWSTAADFAAVRRMRRQPAAVPPKP